MANVFQNNLTTIIDIKATLKALKLRNQESNLPNELPRLEEQKLYARATETIEQIQNLLDIFDQGEITNPSHLPVSEGYEPPSAEEVRKTFQGFSGLQTANLLGVNPRTVRKWHGGEREINYAAWRLFLIKRGLVSERLIKETPGK